MIIYDYVNRTSALNKYLGGGITMRTIVKSREINPIRKNYNWINLPKDSIITDIRFNNITNLVEIYFESESGEVYCCDSEFGFEYYSFKEDEDINIVIRGKCEHRKVVYSKVIDCNGENIFIIISKWIKI